MRVCSFGSEVIMEGDVGVVISQNGPTSPLFKLRKKWFYIGYIERIFQKTNSLLFKITENGRNFSVGLPLNLNLAYNV